MIIKPNPFPIFPDWTKINVNNKKQIRHTIKNENEIFYKIDDNLPYQNHIETAGLYNSTIVFYKVDTNKTFRLAKHLIFPTFRKTQNDTRGSFAIYLENEFDIYLNNKLIDNEKLNSITLNGFINFESSYQNISIKRTLFAAKNHPSFISKVTIKNNNNADISLNFVTNNNVYLEDKGNCFENKQYQIKHHLVFDDRYDSSINCYENTINLNKQKEITFYSIISCMYINDNIGFCVLNELENRNVFLHQLKNNLILKTNNKTLDTMFYFAKIRATESVFNTKNGLMHGPGGGNYYAAIWTNDQLEYANPFFAYMNYKTSFDSAINSMDLYTKYMYKDEPLVSSIIAEATSYWNGAKDRGDCEMYAYGATRFLLTHGDKSLAMNYVKPIKWCLDYSLSKLTCDGLIKSDSDELENRFESGSINLSTNAIGYAALISGADLFDSLGIKNDYRKQANDLYKNIDAYFFNKVEGYKTYRYCKEEINLRSHICYPLINGILTRQEEVINTLLNSKLNTTEGFLTSTAEEVFWDRVTLMAIRGIYLANKSDIASSLLIDYSTNRLLTDHVPYAIEAYPEGNQAHLSAESALYCRIFVEGIMGYRPVSFDEFEIKPSLCKTLNTIEIKNINFHGKLSNLSMKLFDKNNVNIIFNDKSFIVKNNEITKIKMY